jgi:uncharacterized protein YjbI with pentapeptide repeats
LIVLGVTTILVANNGTGFDAYSTTTTSKIISGTTNPIVTSTVVNQPGKTLWDLLQLLIIPLVLAIGGFFINLTISRGEQEATRQRAKTEREIADDNQKEEAIQTYLNIMSELLLHEKLRDSQQTDEVRTIARVRTLTTLDRLDEYRKASVIQFLYEAGLINEGKSIVDLSGADLTKVILSGSTLDGANLSGTFLMFANLLSTNLRGANLSETTLIGATLTNADLTGANLKNASIDLNHHAGDDPIITQLALADFTNADLRGARLNSTDLTDAVFRGADLRGADFKGAQVTQKQLEQAKSLQGAKMMDGSIYS